MSNVKDLQQALLDATKLLSDKSVDQAGYTYTIKCTIKGIENASLNLYTIEYGSNMFNAYANNGVNYKINDLVYVLVPDGKLTEQMQIIGACAPKASMYVTDNESDMYVSITDNLFGSIDQVNLKSWENMTEVVNIDTSNFNLIFNDYLESGKRHFKFTAKVKTEIDKDHQMKGNYGLILNLPFIEASTAGGGSSTTIWRSYVMDVNTMQGNVYNFNTYAKQDFYYELEDDLVYDPSRIPYISAFVSGFGYIEPRTDIDYDIHIRDIGIEMVDVLTVEDAQGYSLTVVASAGNYFLSGKYASSKTLTPVLKVKGKTANKLDKWECYWFVEDTSIDISSEGYLNIGGLGWKCLNKKTNVSYDNTGKMSYQYVTNNYSLAVEVQDVVSTLRYKCVLVQDDVVVGGSVKLKNLNSGIMMELVSATGSNYYVENTGYVDLIARIFYPNRDPAVSISTAWQRFDKNDNYIDNDFYEIVRYNDPVTITDATGTSRIWLETEIKYPCSKLEQINTVNCTFYSTTIFDGTTAKNNLGTSSIIVATARDFTYGIVIDGGDVLYKYDADGDSPLVANYDGPLSSKVKSINPITYRVYKADGSQLTDIEYLYCKYRWSFPKNSMMKLQGYSSQQLNDLEQDDDYYYITGYGKNNINYTILNTYNKKKNNNSILLSVEFAGSILSSTVSPKFLKDGESGTNGTKYSAIITYDGYGYGERDAQGRLRKLQLVYVSSRGWQLYNIENQTLVSMGSPQMGIQVYADGDRISSGYSVTWDMFDNVLSGQASAITNTTCFNINNNGIISSTANWTNSEDIFTNIVRATVIINENSVTDSKEVVYVYYPLEITRVMNDQYLGKIPTLDGGFDQVVFAADGTNPEYDSSDPFSCVDSLSTDTSGYYAYAWSGSVNLKIPSGTTYQSKVIPVSKLDNGVSRNYVKVGLTMSDSQRATINGIIDDLNDQISDISKKIAFYSNNKNRILDFVQKFDYNYYEGILKNSRNLLALRFQSIQVVNNMYSIIEDINEYCKTNNVQIRDFNYVNYYNAGRNSLNTAKRTLYNLLCGGQFNSLTSLSTALITLRESFKDRYGVAVYSQLKALVDSWNSQITENYQPLYVQLVEQTEGHYKYDTELVNLYHNFYLALVDFAEDSDLEYLATAHDGRDPEPEFVNLRNQLIALTNQMSNTDGGLISYNALDEELLQKISELLEIYNNSNYQTSYYDNLDDSLKEQLIELTADRDGYVKSLIPNNTNYIIHIKPIVMVYNRYELSHLNGWDGNKLYVDNTNDQYMFMPQMGAGKKENGTFTGIVMGVKKFNNSSTQHIGLFGYSEGIQSLFLNARDGSAILGKSSAGQIVADPSQSKALLYSYNFWKPSAYGSDGKPTSYNKSNYNKQGMMIDLSTPEIRFGNGNFVVQSNGDTTIAGTGSIAGWKISDTQIYSNLTASNGRITLDSGAVVTGTDADGNKIYTYGNGKLYSHNHNTLASTNAGFYIAADGFSIGSCIRASSADGGSLLVGRVNGSRKWEINGSGSNSYIAYNTTSFNSNSNSVYLGTDGISLGTGKFYVDRDGNLTSRSGTIGGWSIGSSTLTGGSTTLNSNGTIECENLIANSRGSIGGWTIGGSSLSGGGTTLNSNGTITCSRLIADSSGTIGGWSISAGGLSRGSFAINSGGSIIGPGFNLSGSGLTLTNPGGASMNWGSGFSVSTGGILRASGAIIEGNITAYSGNIGGWSISGSGLSNGGSIYLNSNGALGGSSLHLTSTLYADEIYCYSISGNSLSSEISGMKSEIGNRVTKNTYSGTCTVGGVQGTCTIDLR